MIIPPAHDVAELQTAFVRGQLRVHYQPEFDLVSGAVTGVEALLRWQHPTLGLLTADRFVPDAEQTHTFVAIQYWVIEEACRQLARWRADGLATALTLRLNVPGTVLAEQPAVDTLLGALDRFRIPPAQVCVELTERLMPADLADLGAALETLRKLGLTIAIDDFGVGQGTLMHLVALPVDVLKIDQSFVGRMMSNEQAAAVVASVIALARSLRIDVVAEGIDSRDSIDELVRLGCTRGQGNSLGAAMAPEQVRVLLAA